MVREVVNVRMNKILIKIIAAFLLIVIGLFIGVHLHFHLSDFILDLYRWTTGGKIKFIGKGILIPSLFYLILFSISVILIGCQLLFLKTKWIRAVCLWVIIFGLSILIISTINANLMVINCTACIDGILKIRFHNAPYNAILSISSLLSMIPSAAGFIKARKKVKS